MLKFGNCEILEKLQETKHTEIYKAFYPEKNINVILKSLISD